MLRTFLKREESYGIHALATVAQNPGLPFGAIAERLQIPPAYLAKVLAKLKKVGLVESREGHGGGVWLKKAPQEISLLQIIEALSGKLVMDTCQTLEKCPTEQRVGHCKLKPMWHETALQVRDIFSNHMLSSFVN